MILKSQTRLKAAAGSFIGFLASSLCSFSLCAFRFIY
jgi:hypothetical protein